MVRCFIKNSAPWLGWAENRDKIPKKALVLEQFGFESLQIRSVGNFPTSTYEYLTAPNTFWNVGEMSVKMTNLQPIPANIHMRIIFSIVFLCALASQMPAQSTCTVVATSGLRLRATPGQQGKTLAVAPFGAQVTVLQAYPDYTHTNTFSEMRDTVGELRRITFWNNQTQALETRNDLHIGYWWKVRYQGKTGYMFSGFLALENDMGNPDYPYPNDQWRLVAPGGTICVSFRPDWRNEWNWYGVFQRKDGTFDLRSVTLTYKVADYSDQHGYYDLIPRELMVLAANEPDQPLYLIGKKGAWTKRTNIKGIEAYPVEGKKSAFNAPDNEPYPDLLRQFGILVERTEEQSPVNQFYLTDKSGKRQKLLLHYPDNHYQQSPYEVMWVGDLDGDGRYDYIFNVAGEIGAYMLYLSSQAKKGEVAGLVALLWHWYCC